MERNVQQRQKQPSAQLIGGAAALALLAGIVAVKVHTGPRIASAGVDAPPESFPLIGIVRDFRPGHPDFAESAVDELKYSAGNIASMIDGSDLPIYQGGGVEVDKPARDAKGRAIAPRMTSATPVTDFKIAGGKVLNNDKPMAARITVLGAAISAGGAYDLMVTTRINIGSNAYMPFGSFEEAVGGNVNDNANPRHVVLPSMIWPGTELTVDGRSWNRNNPGYSSPNNSDWHEEMTINSAVPKGQVFALRDGDNVPQVGGFMGQADAKAMLSGYFDPATERMTLKDNQVVYLFELGVTDPSSAAFDSQDLVVLVDLASDPSYWDSPDTPVAPCVTINDTPAELDGPDGGGISSASTFGQWFNRAQGENLSDKLTLMMKRDPDGVYVYTTDDWHPIDGDLYGNQGEDHNRGFTFMFDGACTYEGCGKQFIEVICDGDAWMFVNGQLVLDLGGFHKGEGQFVDMDRLGLKDGDPIRVQFFTAQRDEEHAAFTLKTNMVLKSNINSVNAPATEGLAD